MKPINKSSVDADQLEEVQERERESEFRGFAKAHRLRGARKRRGGKKVDRMKLWEEQNHEKELEVEDEIGG